MISGPQLSIFDIAETTTNEATGPQRAVNASVNKKPIVRAKNDLKGAPTEPPLNDKAPLTSTTSNTRASATPDLKTLRGYDAPPTPEECYLSVREVAKRYSVSVPTIWRWAKECSQFPKAISLNSGTSRWRLSDLLAYETRSLEA